MDQALEHLVPAAAALPTKIWKTTPCTVAKWLPVQAFLLSRKTFDTSGKSGVHLHHPAICMSPTALRSSAPFATIASKDSLHQIPSIMAQTTQEK
jgi:hypothetical protein